MLNLDNSIALIGDLISFPTVSSDLNRELLAYVESYLARHGVRSEIIWNEDGSKGNLWATIGPSDRPGVILSGHSDVVPVAGQAWTRDPFRMWQEDHRLCGRGACDMKGFVGIEGFAKETLLPRMQAVAPEASITIDEMVAYAGLDLAVDHSAVTFMKHLLGRNDHAKVAYGTEAGAFTARSGIVSLVCGPGSIDQAHRADEFLAISEIEKCQIFLERLADRLSSDGLPW